MALRNLTLSLLIFCVGCSTVPYDQVLPPGGGGSFVTPVAPEKEYLKNLCDRYDIDWQFDRISQVVTLSKYNSRARILLGSQVMVLDKNKKIILNSPLTMEKNGMINVTPDFKRKILDYFVKMPEPRRANYSLKKVRRIVIDAGHGGKDSGALGFSGLKEKYVVLDIAERLGKILRREGMDVVYTRKNDKFISLQERTVIASKEAADLFVSIHANSAKTRSATGIEVFHLKPLSEIELKEKQRLDNHKHLYKTLNASGNTHVQKIVSDLLYTHKQAESYKLASSISRNLSKDIRARNRGQKNSRFFVLRNTLVPSVLVEVGFLSNAREEKRLKSNVYRQKIARSISESIIKYARD